jgi:hypothetical protein
MFSLKYYSPDTIAEMYRWCRDTIYHDGGGYNWDYVVTGNERYMEFTTEQAYMWFRLRWEGSREIYF